MICLFSLVTSLSLAAVTTGSFARLGWEHFVLPVLVPGLLAPILLRLLLGLLDSVASVGDAYRHLAERDELTGLYNRRGFFARARLQPGGRVIVADVDGFKDVNDTHGHQVGDAVLVAAGKALTALGGDDAVVARTGGDEFVVLWPPGHEDRLPVALDVPVSADLTVHLSIGVIHYSDQMTIDDALLAADRAMYVAKMTAAAPTQRCPHCGRPL